LRRVLDQEQAMRCSEDVDIRLDVPGSGEEQGACRPVNGEVVDPVRDEVVEPGRSVRPGDEELPPRREVGEHITLKSADLRFTHRSASISGPWTFPGPSSSRTTS